MTGATCKSYCVNGKWEGTKTIIFSICFTAILISFYGIVYFYIEKIEYDRFFEHEYNCIINSIEYANCPDNIIINTTIEELNITIQEQVNFRYELTCNNFIINNIVHPRVACSYFEDELVLEIMINTSAPFWFDISLTVFIASIVILVIMYIHFKLSVYENKWTLFKQYFTRENIVKGLEGRITYLERQNTVNNNKINDLENQLKATAPPIYEFNTDSTE